MSVMTDIQPDKTLPIGGGWIYVKKLLPIETYVPALSYWYAMPHRVQLWGSDRIEFNRERLGGYVSGMFTHMHYHEEKYRKALTILWRKRCRAKVDTIDQDHLDDIISRESEETVYSYDDHDRFDIFRNGTTRNPIYEREFVDPCPRHPIGNVPLEMEVKILTPNGSVILKPHEYDIVSNIKDVLSRVDNEHFLLKQFGSDNQKGKIADQIHYIRSRGISQADAITMVMGQVKSQKVYWLEWHRAYAQIYGLNHPSEPVYDITVPDEDRVRIVKV